MHEINDVNDLRIGSATKINKVKNNTKSTIFYMAYATVSARFTDANADFDDYFWRGVLKIKKGEDTSDDYIGYGGSNNKQYQHHTWDTVTRVFPIELNAGSTLEVSVFAEVGCWKNGAFVPSDHNDMTVELKEPSDVLLVITGYE